MIGNNNIINTLPLMNQNIDDSNPSYNLTNDSVKNELNELNESNPYFIEFKDNIRQWIKLDDDLITLTNAMKDIKKKKNELSDIILKFMENNNLKHLNTNDGKIQYTKTSINKALNKNLLLEKLSIYLKDDNKGNSAVDFIFDNREKTEKVTLKRSIKK